MIIAKELVPIDKGLDSEKVLRIWVLGQFEVRQGDRLIGVEEWRSGKARSLFKILLARRGYQISRQEAAELLWPELDQERAFNNLHQAVYSLRRTLEPVLQRANLSVYLKSEGAMLQLNPLLIGWVDLEEFRRVYQQARTTDEISLYEQAAALYGGEYLPEDSYEDWSIFRREALRQEWVELLLRLAEFYQGQGQSEKYQQCLRRVLETNFAHEESAQKLMLALAEGGRRDEALAFYHSFAAKLQHRLDITPLKETQKIYHDIATGLKQEPTISADRSMFWSGAVNSVETKAVVVDWPTRPELPDPGLTLGRNLEQQGWQQALQKARLGKGSLTLLIGEAGVGKTHLVQALARQAAADGLEVIYIACYPEQAERPSNNIQRLLEQALLRLTQAEREECAHYCNSQLYGLLPDLTTYFFSDSAALVAALSPQNLFALVAQVLVWLDRKQSIALVLDDLHYLSGASVRLARYLLTHPGLRALPILGTLRPNQGELTQLELNHLLDLTATISLSVQRLPRLDHGELAQLLTAQLGQFYGQSVIETVFRLTQGNPRLALEMVRSWLNEGELRSVEGFWEIDPTWNGLPSVSLRAYIKRMVGSLSQEAQVLLSLAALAGPTFSFELLRRVVLHRSDGAGWWIGLDKTRLGAALTEAVEGGLLAEEGTNYRFAYPLLVETLVASLSPSQRQSWREVLEWAKITADG